MRETNEGSGETADDEAVHGLYEASAGLKPWRPALLATNAALGASFSKLVTADAVTKRIVAVEDSNHEAAPTAAEPSIDRQLEALWTRPVAEVLCRGHAPGAANGDAPKAARLIAAKVREHRCHMTFVSFAATHAAAFTPTQFELARRYIAHLATALKVTQHCEDMKTDATIGRRLLHCSSRPMLLLGRGSTILACNASARVLLQQANVIHAEGCVLKCRVQASETALAKVIDRFLQPASRNGERRTRAAVKLIDTNGEPVLCSVASMMSEEATTPVDNHPVALLSFASLQVAETQSDPAFLASLYGFTKAEIRLVSALLRGEDLIQIATRNLVSLATVRSQLKSVFAKTNTHRQAAVIQLLLTAMLL